jgi:hypothetical protein
MHKRCPRWRCAVLQQVDVVLPLYVQAIISGIKESRLAAEHNT